MRNLKKILALVLALVMSLSLVTIANAADFTDADEIDYEEAVAVMSTIGVINGMDDGSYDPDSILTREQAAKLITYMLLGSNAEKLGVESSTFKDVAVTRWSAPSIEYCATLGIIDGEGDGNFYPAGQLTGYAFAKMLLTAIGYDSKIEGFTGSSWSINVAALANEVGLDDGLENGITSAYVSRQEAAQMALNAIKTPLVTYDKQASITVNGAEVNIGAAEAKYVTTTLAKEQRISDQQLTNSNDYTVEFGEKYFPNLRLISEADEFERPSHTWTYNGDEIGSYTDYDLQVATYTEAITGRDLYDLLGKSTIEEYSIAYYVDGAVNDNIKASNMIRTNTVKYNTTGNGVLTQVFVDHDDEEITITSVNTYLAKANADYNETRGELSLTVYQSNAVGTGKTVDVEDIAHITDYKEGDFMLVNMAAIGTTGDKMEVVRVNDVDSMVDCTVTSYSTGKTVTVDGTDYDYAAKAYYDDDVLDEYNQGYLGDYTYTFYMDQYGYVIGAEIYEGEANYVFITGYDLNGSNLSVKTADAAAIFLDGTMSKIEVNVNATDDNIQDYNVGKTSGKYLELRKDQVDNGNSEYNRWFRYTTDKDGVYTLTPVEYWVNETATDDGDEVNSASIRVSSGSTRAYGNDDSVYITVDAGTVDLTTNVGITKVTGTYTGVQSVDLNVFSKDENPLASDTSIFALYDNNSNGRYIIGAIIVGEDINNTKNYAYILDTDAQREYRDNGTDFWEVEAVVDGQIVTLTVADYNNTINKIQSYVNRYQGAMYRVTYNADNQVIEAELCEDIAYGNANGDYVYGSTELCTTVGDPAYDKFDYTGRDIDPDYDKIYNVNVSSAVTDQALNIGGNTLYIGTEEDFGLALAKAPIIVVQEVVDQAGAHVKLSREVYSSVSQALDTLKDKTAFTGNLSAVLNANGTAAYLVINSYDAVSITTDDGSTASGSLPTIYANAYSRYGMNLHGSRANVTYKIPNPTFGTMVATVDYTAPAWVPDGASVTLKANVLYNNSIVDTMTFTGTINNGKATMTANSTNPWQYMGWEDLSSFTFRLQANGETFSDVNVYYVDADNNNIKASMTNPTDTLPVSGSAEALRIQMANTAADATNVGITISGIASGDFSTNRTAKWLRDGWSNNYNATNAAPVVVQLDLGALVNLYTLTKDTDFATNHSAIDNAVKQTSATATDVSDYNPALTGHDDDIKVEWSPAGPSYEKDDLVTFTVTATASDEDEAEVTSYKVTIKTTDKDIVISGVKAVDGGKGYNYDYRMPAKNVEITDVTVEVDQPAVTVKSVEMSKDNNYTVNVTFTNGVKGSGAGSALDTTDITGTTTAVSSVSHTAGSNTAVLTMDAAMKTGDTITFEANKIINTDNADNILVTETWELQADGSFEKQ